MYRLIWVLTIHILHKCSILALHIIWAVQSENVSLSMGKMHTFRSILFVCVEVLWPSQPNGVMSSAVSLPNHTFTGQV